MIPVVVRRSQYFIGDVPWQLINSYYPSDLAKGTALEQAGEIEVGSVGLLAELGHPQQGFVDEIGARMPNAREFDFFKLASGTPVIVVNRTSYSTDRPIRLTRYIYRADRVRLLHVEGKHSGGLPARLTEGGGIGQAEPLLPGPDCGYRIGMLALLLVAASVGMSNFAAAIAIGVSGVDARTRLRVGLVFGVFESGMPVLGLLLGAQVAGDAWARRALDRGRLADRGRGLCAV